MYWFDMAEENDRWRALVIKVMNLLVTQNAGKFVSRCTTGGFSRRAQPHEVNKIEINPENHPVSIPVDKNVPILGVN
jgi:hypothetical protein